MFLVFDTETTGIPKRVNGKYPDPTIGANYDNARIIEIAWGVYNQSGKCLKRRKTLVKYDGAINNSHIHGITQTMVKTGRDFAEIAQVFMTDLNDVHTIVAHNIWFDIYVLLSELHRINRKDICGHIRSKQKADTMRLGCAYLNHHRSYIKLMDLYNKLYPTNPGRLFTDTNPGHRAMVDVKACALCYHKICVNIHKTNNNHTNNHHTNKPHTNKHEPNNHEPNKQ